MSMIENNDIILKYILKQIQVPCNLLLMFEGTRDAPVKRLKAIATQKKLPRSLLFKPGCFLKFRKNLLMGYFKIYTSENYLNRQYRIFNLAEKLKSFIALNYLGFDFIMDITVLNCGKEALYLSFLKYTGSLTMTRNVFVVDLITASK